MEGIEVEGGHPKTFIHIDIDYYYAQVEEILNESLRTKPLGIQQKNCLVTCNYIAREQGVKKLMSVSESQKLCPDLVLVNGEDISRYKDMSIKIFDVIRTFTPNVERLGLDENFIDVTTLINDKLNGLEDSEKNNLKLEGNIVPDEKSLSNCRCGCDKRLILGSHLAKEIRDKIYKELKLTCCAGIGHNKILAKLIGSVNKPNKQTTLVPCCASSFLSGLGAVRNITGIGNKTESLLNEIGIETVQQLQDCDLETLKKKFGYDTACRLKDISVGNDSSILKPSSKPKSIGLEDSCKTISLKADVEEKFRLLLVRLVKQIGEDGRIPVSLRITLRKYDSQKKTSHRETKQCNVLPSIFKTHNGKVILVDEGQDKLLKIIMRLFEKTIDMKKPFNITLIGLAFTKFQEKKTGRSSIANFLIKKSDIEVQSVTNLSNESSFNDSSIISNTSKIISMDYDQVSSDTSITSDNGLLDNDIEPSPKKSRLGLLIAKRRCLATSDSLEISSPSKLRVADLRLNSKDSERDNSFRQQNTNFNLYRDHQSPNNSSTTCSSSNYHLNNNNNAICPSGVDPLVFKELPLDVQNELLASWRTSANTSTPISQKNSTPATGKNTLLRYFIKNN